MHITTAECINLSNVCTTWNSDKNFTTLQPFLIVALHTLQMCMHIRLALNTLGQPKSETI